MVRAFLILLGGVLAAAGLYWLWARRTAADIAESAGLEWTRLQTAEPDLIAGLDEARFRTIFHRVHFPRFPKYALAAAAAFILSLPVSLGLLGGLAWLLGSIGLAEATEVAKMVPLFGTERWVGRDEGELIAFYWVQDIFLFFYYFGLLAVWLAIVFVAMRRYHRRRPGYLRDELLSAQGKGAP